MPRGDNLAAVRPAGRSTPNKVTRAAKEALEYAFDGMGGAEALKTWAEANPDSFYRLWAKLMPKNLEVSGPTGGAITVRFVREGK
jgi:hypothetical protein